MIQVLSSRLRDVFYRLSDPFILNTKQQTELMVRFKQQLEH